ncbi:MAG: LLM class flavin-dependent oxidoreductase [Xanthobacteraceae bacterium]|jgi:alkanesulfonate monooxygenase SsuD/methylene tetrahydromethanopterin reductase-like flavin-dependent oxidoreductase (luciferase family)
MKFSIYSELQTWPWKTQAQVYAEALEQCVNADRLGYSTYSIIEHFFFPKFGASPNPFAFFAKASERTRNINFRTLVHVLPYHNPAVLASQIAQFDMLVDGRYEFGFGRGHAWIPLKGGVPVEESRERYEEALKIVIDALDNERFSADGKYYKIHDSHIVPRPTPGRKFRIFLGGTNDYTYELAGERGYAMVVPPLLPYEALRPQLDIYRASCKKHGNKPDIVWIHACHLDFDRDTAKREAEKMMRGFLKGNASVLLENKDELPSKQVLEASGYGFYASGIMENFSDMPYDEMIKNDIVWVGTPDDVIERIEAVMKLCEGLTEVAITVNPGGVEHWKTIKTQEMFAHHVMPHFAGKNPAAGTSLAA